MRATWSWRSFKDAKNSRRVTEAFDMAEYQHLGAESMPTEHDRVSGVPPAASFRPVGLQGTNDGWSLGFVAGSVAKQEQKLDHGIALLGIK